MWFEQERLVALIGRIHIRVHHAYIATRQERWMKQRCTGKKLGRRLLMEFPAHSVEAKPLQATR